MHSIILSIFMAFSIAKAQDQIQENSAQKTKYDLIVERMEKIAAQNPNRIEMFELGKNNQDVMIKGLKFTGPDTNGDKIVEIQNLVVATHHGNEYGSTELAMGFAESLADKPVDEQIIYVIPVLNVQGYNVGRRWEKVDDEDHDPNRDYPGPCGSEGPHKLKSTQLLADFVLNNKIVISATLHTFWPGVFYPWGIPTKDLETPYNDLYIQLAKYGVVGSDYQYGNSTEILYPVVGAYEDWAYWAGGTWSLLFEVGHSHNPSPVDVQEMIKLNVPGLREYFIKGPTERAVEHDFKGVCDNSHRWMDLHSE